MVHERRWPILVTLLFAAVTLTGCAFIEEAGLKRRGANNARLALSRQGKKNTYVSLRSLTRRPSNAAVIFDRDLRPPFRVETVTGMFNPRRQRGIVDQATFGMELDAPGATLPVTQFYGISVRPETAGVSVFSGSHKSGGAPHGSTVFASGTTMFDLAIEHDGEVLHFFARRHGDSEWLDLGVVDTTGDPFPVQPALGVFAARRPGEVGYDDFRIVSNGPRPGGLSPEEELVEDIWELLDAITSAAHLLDGDEPGVAGARDLLAIYPDEHGRIIDALDALANPGKRRPRIGPAAAARKMRISRRAFETAATQLDAILSRQKRRRATPQSAARLLRTATVAGVGALTAIRRGIEAE